MELYERIAKVFADSGKKRIECASLLGVSQPTVSQYCSGKTLPSSRTLSDICRVFHVRYEWLTREEGEPYETPTQDQELADFFAAVIPDADESIRKRFLVAASRMPPSFWDSVAAFAKELSGE